MRNARKNRMRNGSWLPHQNLDVTGGLMQAVLWRGDSLTVPKSQLSGETKAQKQQTPHEAGLVLPARPGKLVIWTIARIPEIAGLVKAKTPVFATGSFVPIFQPLRAGCGPQPEGNRHA
jgi:hypothetical protein